MTYNNRITVQSFVAAMVVYGVMNVPTYNPQALSIAIVSFFGFALLQYAVRIVKLLETKKS